MKIRNGFVSNSSSSSFVIYKRDLDEWQIEMIKDYRSVCEKMCEQNTNLQYMYGYDTPWSITETDYTIEGDTWMDNFDMYDFLIKFVKVDRNIISWD